MYVNVLLTLWSKVNQTCSRLDERCIKFATSNCHKHHCLELDVLTNKNTRCLAIFTFNLTHWTHDAFIIKKTFNDI